MRLLVGLVALFPLVAGAQALSPCQMDNGTIVVVPGATCLGPNGLAVTFTDFPPPFANTVADVFVYVPPFPPMPVILPPPPPPQLITFSVGGIALAQSVNAPELDPASLGGALTLLGGGVLVLRGRRLRAR
jgi:hypothetical protein